MKNENETQPGQGRVERHYSLTRQELIDEIVKAIRLKIKSGELVLPGECWNKSLRRVNNVVAATDGDLFSKKKSN